jgi:hypothetical protein
VNHTDVAQEQIDEYTNDDKTICDALVHVNDAGTIAGQDSKTFFVDLKRSRSQTPYIDDVVSQLEPKVQTLRDAKIEGTEEGVRLLQEKLDLLKGPDAGKEEASL